MKKYVYPIMIFDTDTKSVKGIVGVYDSYDSAANHLEDSFMHGFIEPTDIEDMYVNCEGELLIIQKYEVHHEDYGNCGPNDYDWFDD